MELREFLRFVRNRWILIAFLTLAGLAVGAVATILTPAKYQAKTLSFVSVQAVAESFLDQSALQQGFLYSQNVIKSLSQAADSPAVLNKVVADPRLRLGGESASDLARDVGVNVVLDTVNIEITVTRSDPVEAANVANAVTASFREQAEALTRPAPDRPSPIVITTLTPAAVPSGPASPNVKLNLAIGTLGGLSLGLALALLRERLVAPPESQREPPPLATGAASSPKHRYGGVKLPRPTTTEVPWATESVSVGESIDGDDFTDDPGELGGPTAHAQQ